MKLPGGEDLDAINIEAVAAVVVNDGARANQDELSLLQYWCDCKLFELRRNTSSDDGLVDNFCEERLQSR